MTDQPTAWVPGLVWEWVREVWGEIHTGEETPTPLQVRKRGRGASYLVPVTDALGRYCEQEAELYTGAGVDPEHRGRAHPFRTAAERIRTALTDRS